MRISNIPWSKIPSNAYVKDHVIYMKVQADKSLESTLKYNQDETF